LIFLIPSATISQTICATIAVDIENKPTPIPLDMQPVSITETDPEIQIGSFGCTRRQTKAAPKKTMEKI
jgi:hypothetical protein